MADCYLNKWVCKSCYIRLCDVNDRRVETYPMPNLDTIKCLYCNSPAECYVCALGSEFRKGNINENI